MARKFAKIKKPRKYTGSLSKTVGSWGKKLERAQKKPLYSGKKTTGPRWWN